MTQPPANDKPLPNVKPDYPYKTRDFLIGFIGWFVINGLMWAVSGVGLRESQKPFNFVGSGTSAFGPWICLVLPSNVGALIVLGFKRPWIALGALAAFAVNIVVTLIMGVLTAGVCGIPFFLP